MKDHFVVVWINEHDDVFRIRPMHGGPARVVHRTQPSVGSVVYLKQCPFSGRHKVKDSYMKDHFVVVWINEHDDVFRIRPMHGGPARVVHRTLLRMSPFGDEPDVHVRSEDTSSSEEEYEVRLEFSNV